MEKVFWLSILFQPSLAKLQQVTTIIGTRGGPWQMNTLDTREVINPEVANCLRDAQNIGQTMFREFVSERKQKVTQPLSDIIPRVRLYTFSNRLLADLKKSVTKSQTLYSSPSYFFFPWRQGLMPISMNFSIMRTSVNHLFNKPRKLMSGTKSTLPNCLPAMPNPGCRDASMESTVVLFDMATIIHMLKPQRASLFGEYTQMQLLPFLEGQLTECCTRVDAEWDTYHISSFKSQTRINRGETAGRRTKVSPKIPLPKGSEWKRFLNHWTGSTGSFLHIFFLHVQFWIRLAAVSKRGKKVWTVAFPAVRSVNKSSDTRNCVQNKPNYAICVILTTCSYYKALWLINVSTGHGLCHGDNPWKFRNNVIV